MSERKGKPGRDHTFNITIKSDGVAQDLTVIEGVALVAFIAPKVIVEKWSFNAVSGFETMIQIDAPAGLVRIHLARAKTIGLEGKQVYIEVVPQINDTDFGDLQLSDLNGASEKLIFLTSAGKETLPDLS